MSPRPSSRSRAARTGAAALLGALVLLGAGCSEGADPQVEAFTPATFRPGAISPTTTSARPFLSPDIEDQFARDMAAARAGVGSPSTTARRASTTSSSSTSTTVATGPSPSSSVTPDASSTSTTAPAAEPPEEAAPGRPAACDPTLAFEREMRDLLKEINGRDIQEARTKVQAYLDRKGDALSKLRDEAPEPIKGAIANQVAWLNTLAAGNEPNNSDFESAVTTVRGWIEPNCGESI